MLSHVQAVSEAQPMWVQEVLNSYAVDPEAQALLQELAVVGTNTEGYTLQQGIIRQQNRVFVGINAGLQTKTIHAFHASVVGGHLGMQATYERIYKLFLWKGMKQDVENFVKQCVVCQHAKHENCQKHGLLHPLPVPKEAWKDIDMDFIEGLPKSNGYSAILVVVDRFTKFAHFILLKHPCTAASIDQIFWDNVVKLHSYPISIVSGRDKIFTSAFWKELFKRNGTQLNLSTSYHPQSDGQTERVNQCVSKCFCVVLSVIPNKWAYWLPQAKFWYNTKYHTALGSTPFMALYDTEPNILMVPPVETTLSPEASSMLSEREQCLDRYFVSDP